MGPVAVDPNREVDRLSASYLIALGARVIREVGDLVRRANGDGQTPGDPVGGYRGPLPVADGPGGVQQRTHRSHRDTRFEVSRCIRPRRPRASPGDRGAPATPEVRSQGADHERESRKPTDAVPSRSNSRSPARRRKCGRPSPPDRVFRPGSCRLSSRRSDGKPVAVKFKFGPGMEIARCHHGVGSAADVCRGG